MRTLVAAVALLSLVATGGVAFAEIGTADSVPAATLLLPFFEVDFNSSAGITTLLSINNASASAAVAHVTLWTDQGIPTFAFDVYLTGYDVQTINVRDIFNGVLPVTADTGVDTADTNNPNNGISNKGILSQDINFPGTTGPCGSPSTLYNAPDPTLAAKIDHIRQSHTGQFSPIYGGCVGSNYGDGLARGYITVDSVTQCNLLFPNSATYFSGGIADSRNILWGDYFFVNPSQNSAYGDTLVHIESCSIPSVGNGAGQCPFAPGDYTFYGRYAATAGQDQREPLATTFATRYINGSAFDGGTSLLVWRDTKTPVSGNGAHSCASPGPSAWYPLAQTDVVAFDEQENPTDQCVLTNNVAPVISPTKSCFPLATQRIQTGGGNVFAQDMALPSAFGWLYLNLNFNILSDPFPGVAQAWVTTVMDASGRFSVGFQAIQLDNALSTVPNGVVLLP